MAKMTLADARDMLGWTQTRLAREVGAPISTVHELETGANKNPGYALVMRVVKALQKGGLAGLEPEDIFPVVGGQPTPNSKRRRVA
jgi:DNA-binding XRE family transcriptional regulator